MTTQRSYFYLFFFFFSSRRRHTRFDCDWSSDVCSSDLFSKAYAMTGYRLGYVIAPRDRIRALQTLYGNFFISTNEFVQWAGVAALREAGGERRRFRALFDERPRAALAGVRALGFGGACGPPGACYVPA